MLGTPFPLNFWVLPISAASIIYTEKKKKKKKKKKQPRSFAPLYSIDNRGTERFNNIIDLIIEGNYYGKYQGSSGIFFFLFSIVTTNLLRNSGVRIHISFNFYYISKFAELSKEINHESIL